MQQDALHVVDAKALYNAWWQHARREGSPEDLLELQVQAPDAQLLKVELARLRVTQVRESCPALVAGAFGKPVP